MRDLDSSKILTGILNLKILKLNRTNSKQEKIIFKLNNRLKAQAVKITELTAKLAELERSYISILLQLIGERSSALLKFYHSYSSPTFNTSSSVNEKNVSIQILSHPTLQLSHSIIIFCIYSCLPLMSCISLLTRPISTSRRNLSMIRLHPHVPLPLRMCPLQWHPPLHSRS